MTDYKTMYHILGKGISEAIEVVEQAIVQTDASMKVLTVLIQAQKDAEEVYIETCEEENADQ